MAAAHGRNRLPPIRSWQEVTTSKSMIASPQRRCGQALESLQLSGIDIVW